MSLEKTRAAAENHTLEEIAAEKDLNSEEVKTSTEAGHSEEKQIESEEDTSKNEDESSEQDDDESDDSVDYWKQKAMKAERDRDIYKQGLMAKKAKERSIDLKPVLQQEESTDEVEQKTYSDVDIDDQKVLSVLERQNEKRVLREVIDPRSSSYIPELVDDTNYNEILGYLPRSLDKSSPESITKALRLATKMWKEDRGIKDKPKDKGKSVASDLSSVKSSVSGGSAPRVETKGLRKILKKKPSVQDWYK